MAVAHIFLSGFRKTCRMCRDFYTHLRACFAFRESEGLTVSGTPGPEGNLPPRVLRLQHRKLTLCACSSGPEGFEDLQERHSNKENHLDWLVPKAYATGRSTTLYDRQPVGGKHTGDPVADSYGVLAYCNGAVLACADGVNWGPRPRKAARAAVYGSLTHMHQCLTATGSDVAGSWPETTDQIYGMMLQAVSRAQDLVVLEEGTMTTLALATVLHSASSHHPPKWAVCALTAGDSSVFLYRQKDSVVEELSYAAHDGLARDPRICPSALGFAKGEEWDLSTMTLTLATAQEGDIVFLTSDGVWDNFEPVILKEALLNTYSCNQGHQLPCLSPRSCHGRALQKMEEVLRSCREQQPSKMLSAEGLVECLLSHVFHVTHAHRTRIEERLQGEDEQQLGLDLAKLPGKLDHATVVAYMVGRSLP